MTVIELCVKMQILMADNTHSARFGSIYMTNREFNRLDDEISMALLRRYAVNYGESHECIVTGIEYVSPALRKANYVLARMVRGGTGTSANAKNRLYFKARCNNPEWENGIPFQTLSNRTAESFSPEEIERIYKVVQLICSCCINGTAISEVEFIDKSEYDAIRNHVQ